MIRKHDTNSRRILQFPAVRPCESISPTILLPSLISLCNNISNFQFKTFNTQKKISREIFRQIDILLIFLEEIRENSPIFTNSLVLCLSELHFTLQKIHFLLQDFTKDGTKLYILMKSQEITNQFGVLIHSIASSFDILNLHILKISYDSKELVELLAKQARKFKPETNPNDEWAMERVKFMLHQFENKLEPERVSIKWVLDYLGINNWVDCNKEIIFLENEMSNNFEENEREMCILSSLLGFMCYCRGIIFYIKTDKEFKDRTDDSSVLSGRGLIKYLNPEDFRCPISLELMTDPVIISTGHTYDRGSIGKWLNAGHMICPKTGEKLINIDLIPNVVVKNVIHKFCAENGVVLSKPGKKNRDFLKANGAHSPSLACKEAIRLLAQFLAGRLSYGTDEHKNKAANEIRLLSKSSVFNRTILIEVGNVAPLLDLLTSNDENTQENAIAALLKLAKHTKGQKAIIEDGGLMLIILVLRHGLKPESRQIAAATIFYLTSVEKYRKLIGSTREAIPGLVELIMDGTITGKKNAMAALFGLLLYDGNHERAIEAGIITVLLDLISSVQRSDLLADALAILASIGEKIDGSIAILETRALKLIIGVLKSSISRGGKECCVSIMLSLCKHGGTKGVADLAKEKGIMPSLYSIVVEGSFHGSKKARTLIGLLQEFQESSSSSLATASAVRKERPVINVSSIG